MTNELVAALVGAIVGASITGFFGWWLPFLQEKRSLNQKRQLYTLALIDDLKNSPSLFEKITNDWNKTGQIWYEYIIELKEQRKIYQRYPDYLLLYPETVRQEIFKYYLKTDKLIYLLELSQNRIQYLLNEYINTIKIIKKSKIGITDEDAQKEALLSLAEEDKEVSRIKSLISLQINQLSEISKEAANLCTKLNEYSEGI